MCLVSAKIEYSKFFFGGGKHNQKFFKLTLKGNYSKVMLKSILIEKRKPQSHDTVIEVMWQGRRDSNTQPTVLETATLPLSHSPKKLIHYITKKIFSQMVF